MHLIVLAGVSCSGKTTWALFDDALSGLLQGAETPVFRYDEEAFCALRQFSFTQGTLVLQYDMMRVAEGITAAFEKDMLPSLFQKAETVTVVTVWERKERLIRRCDARRRALWHSFRLWYAPVRTLKRIRRLQKKVFNYEHSKVIEQTYKSWFAFLGGQPQKIEHYLKQSTSSVLLFTEDVKTCLSVPDLRHCFGDVVSQDHEKR